MKVSRVIRAADERTGGDIEKTFVARDIAVIVELLWRDVLDHGQVFLARTQILAHRKNLAAHVAQMVHRLKKLGLFLAEAEHYATFGHNSAAAGAQLLCSQQNLQ